MGGTKTSMQLFDLLDAALARELQVSVQYMLQHTLWGGKTSDSESKINPSKPDKFVASHMPVYFPGKSLKKIAIAEMRHAEKIAERITLLGGEIKNSIPPFKTGISIKEILELDKNQEEDAIQLYNKIIEMTKKEGDETTLEMFNKILLDEKKHHETFSNLLKMI